ncbi:S8 family serine peptidase [Sinomonas sp. P10A9]|uniref:S8 family serine peptidase n=1 Tax=Sinomonas puerhi TaxID=3238584 RepID=A0AB39L3X3_9MICC
MKKTILASIAAAIIAVSPLAAVPAASARDQPPSHVAGQILVKFSDNRASAGVLREHGLSDGPNIGSTGARLITVPAGIVAAIADNSIGVAGVCPGCVILNGKVLDDSGSGSSSAIARGIDWAVANGAKVINMSLAMRFSSLTLETAVNNAWNHGVVIVAAAGNSGSQAKMYPAAYTNVIAVAATDNNDAKASFSTYGAKWVDLAAPGVSVYSTFPNHPFALQTTYNRSLDYDIGSGTSMASPIVAATVALAWNAHPAYTNADVRAHVESTADKIAGTGSYWANGRVNANGAVH